jgi:hypothetical protein
VPYISGYQQGKCNTNRQPKNINEREKLSLATNMVSALCSYPFNTLLSSSFNPQLFYKVINHILILAFKGRAGNVDKRFTGFKVFTTFWAMLFAGF